MHHADDLAAIRRIMDDARDAVPVGGVHFIIWGAVAGIGIAATWAAVHGALPFSVNPVWVALIAAGWVASMRAGRREHALAPVTTLATRMLAVLWVGCGVSITVIATAAMFGGVVPVRALPGLLAVIFGLGFLGTATLTGMRALVVLAAAWWIGGAAMLAIPGTWSLLALGIMTVLLQVVPGIALQRRRRPREA